MPKTPDQVDKLIRDDVFDQDSILFRLEREYEFHKKRKKELEEKIGCDHEPEFLNSKSDKCRHCGYEWVR